MKKIGTYTVRGSIVDPTTGLIDGIEETVRLFDGRFDTAYKVIKFDITTGDASQQDVTARLATEPNLSTAILDFWNWGDQRQIGWACNNGSTDTFAIDNVSFLDPDNLIVEDLHVSFRFNHADTNRVNYMITMEKYDITSAKGALAMVRNKSQGSSA